MKQKTLFLVAIGTGLLMSAQVFSQQQDSIDYREGYGLVLEQRWNEVQAHFIEFQSNYPDSAWTDDAAFWNCYAIEQASTEREEQFNCYQQFVDSFPDSSYVADASSKLAVLGSRLASRGSPEFITRLMEQSEVDFEFEFNAEEFSETFEETMALAEQEMERLREYGIDVPSMPDLPDLRIVTGDVQRINIDIDDIRDDALRMRDDMQRSRIEMQRMGREMRFRRNSADDELLTVIAALRDNVCAAEILIERLRSTDNPEMRARLVMLLEDFEGEQISAALVDVINNDSSQEVRNNAVFALLDRNEEASRDLLLDIAMSSEFPTNVRAEILDDMEDWDENLAVSTLESILAAEDDPVLVSEAADSLADIGSEAALNVLFDMFQSKQDPTARQLILEQIADVETPEVIAFLTDIALSGQDDEVAVIAIEGIADREDNIAVAALDHIFVNSTSQQRRLAILSGIGDSETQQAVELLERVLNSETEPEVVAAAVRALGDTELASAVPLVLDTYRNNTDEQVQRAAIRALRRLDDRPAATEGLLEMLEDQLNQPVDQ